MFCKKVGFIWYWKVYWACTAMTHDYLSYTLYPEKHFSVASYDTIWFQKDESLISYSKNQRFMFWNKRWCCIIPERLLVNFITKRDCWQVWIIQSLMSTNASLKIRNFLGYSKAILFSKVTTSTKRYSAEKHPWMCSQISHFILTSCIFRHKNSLSTF